MANVYLRLAAVEVRTTAGGESWNEEPLNPGKKQNRWFLSAHVTRHVDIYLIDELQQSRKVVIPEEPTGALRVEASARRMMPMLVPP